MRPFRFAFASIIALAGLAGSAQAGWNSVFQVTCFHRSTPVIARYEPDPCNPCPQPVVTTRYVQRCYYQPTISYQTRSYYEPVTTYRTSYYYEPVTSLRYTCMYDPCTCQYREVATPYTTHRLRSQCCPVTSWVQRCCSVPVQTYQKCCYWEAQSCYTLIDPCAPSGIPAAPYLGTPGVTENRAPATQTPGVQEFRGGTGSPLYDQRYGTSPPEGSGSSWHKSQKAPAPVAKPKPPVQPKLDRIAFEDANRPIQANLVGTILQPDASQPRPGATLVFVNEKEGGKPESATADSSGRFRVQLASGNWSLYVRNPDGKAVLLSKLDVRANEVQQMTLVSR